LTFTLTSSIGWILTRKTEFESIRIVDSETQMSIRRTEYATLWTRQIAVRPIDRMTQAVIYDSERTYRELRAVEVELTFPVKKVSPVKIDKFISVPSFQHRRFNCLQGQDGSGYPIS